MSVSGAKREAFAARRGAMGFTQESLAEAVGVEFSTVGRWERGVLTPQPWRRPRLARVLKVSLEELDDLLDPDVAGVPVSNSLQVAEHQTAPGKPDNGRFGQSGTAPVPGNELQEADVGKSPSPVKSSEPNRRIFLKTSGITAIGATLSTPPAVLQALEIVTSQDADTLDIAADCLEELVCHYSEKLPVAPPSEVYGDLLAVRKFADSLLVRSDSSTRRRADVIASTGWISNLLAVATSYMGNHGSSLVWCLDAERHGHNSGNRDIAAWATFTRATMAYYQGRTNSSAELSGTGQRIASPGTVVFAKLASHEMRSVAMVGDVRRMQEAKKRATAAIEGLQASTTRSGVFSIALSEDPPYTATSLLLLQRFEEAALATERVIETAYGADAGDHGGLSSNHSRTLLILGLARAGIGDVDGAVAAGRQALDGSVVWPTLVLARKLDQALMRTHRSLPEVVEYHELCRSLADSVTVGGNE
ncbi:hypothetical protein GCM10022243_32250 [Saccharothrix violaceirubra]